jgi:hypothetical protein
MVPLLRWIPADVVLALGHAQWMESSAATMQSATTEHLEPLQAYGQPAEGWGSLKAIALSVVREGAPIATVKALRQQHKPRGFACVTCRGV